eukprot:SAG31_NODE_862_length_11416_cov_8.600336_10_plen_314_part_00
MRQSRRTTSSVIRHGHDRFITVSFQSRRSHGTQGDKTAGSDRLSFRHKAEPAFMSRSEKNSAVALSAEEVAVVKQLEGKLKNPIFADAVTAQLSAGTRRTLAISAINHDTHYYAPGQRAAAAAAADLNKYAGHAVCTCTCSFTNLSIRMVIVAVSCCCSDGYIHRRELNKWLATYGASVSSKIDIKIAPTRLQLALVAFNASIPFIGFGFLDNFIMITAGDMIDAKLGTTLALSSLGAAALGNTVSDVTGMGVGGIIEEGAKRLGLPQAKLSPHQMDLAVTKFAGTLGGTFGIAMVCTRADTHVVNSVLWHHG